MNLAVCCPAERVPTGHTSESMVQTTCVDAAYAGADDGVLQCYISGYNLQSSTRSKLDLAWWVVHTVYF